MQVICLPPIDWDLYSTTNETELIFNLDKIELGEQVDHKKGCFLSLSEYENSLSSQEGLKYRSYCTPTYHYSKTVSAPSVSNDELDELTNMEMSELGQAKIKYIDEQRAKMSGWDRFWLDVKNNLNPFNW